MSTDGLTLSQALEDQALDKGTRVLGRVFKVPVTLTPGLQELLRRGAEIHGGPRGPRMRIEETLQAAAKSVRAMPDARRIAFHVDFGAKSGKPDDADLVAALVTGGDGPCVKIGVPSDFLPTKSFIVRKNCEYSIAIEAVDEADALRQADAIPTLEWTAAWSEHEAELEGQVCDECRSYGPRSTCDCVK